jgi:hypothetical protein
VVSLTEARVSEILTVGGEVDAPPREVGVRGIVCPYCRNTGRIEFARACECKQPNGSCNGRCDDGWNYSWEFCDRCDAGAAR